MCDKYIYIYLNQYQYPLTNYLGTGRLGEIIQVSKTNFEPVREQEENISIAYKIW